MKTKLGIPLDMAALLAIIRPTCANSAITIPAYAAAPFIPILPQQPTRPLGLHQSPLCLILPKTQPTLHLGISIQTQSQRSEIPSFIPAIRKSHPRHIIFGHRKFICSKIPILASLLLLFLKLFLKIGFNLKKNRKK